MIRSAQNTTKRLLVGESGIAMPVSLLVFLFLTFVCMSVFALGEAIRVRTELQYKVDNAAYAAALVQADSLSRIAVLNRALAWTYAQTNNRQVNYIMNRWLSETYETFIRDADAMEKKHIEGSSAACNLHNLATRRSDRDNPRRHTSSYIDGTDDLCYGLALAKPDIGTFIDALSLQLHGRLCSSGERGIKVLQEEVIDTVPLNEYEAISAQLFAGHKNIINMSKAAEEIKKSMDGRIRQVVQTMLEGTESCVFSTDLSEFLEKNIDESDVLKRYDIQTGGSLRSDAYWQKTWWKQTKSNSLARSYTGKGVPELQWIGYAVSWVCNIHGHTPTLRAVSEERISTPGQHPDQTRWQTENWNELPEAEIFRLKENFFSKDGAVVVAAKTPIPDLFGNVFGKNKFLNFRVDGNLWAVSAARAGYRIPGETRYENSKFSNEDKWNLFVDDWEPMFLPVSRCWKSWDGEKFTGDGAYKVLEGVADKLGIDISENGLNLNEKVDLDMLH